MAISDEIKKLVPVQSNGAKVGLTALGKAYFFSPGIAHPTQSSEGQLAYAGTQKILLLESAGTGVVTLFSGGGVYFSPNGQDLGGSGNTKRAYSGKQAVKNIVGVNGGVVTQFSLGGVYFSPDGMNLGGGGSTVRAYKGTQAITGMLPTADGLLTRFSGGGVYLSATGTDLGGTGLTAGAKYIYRGPLGTLTKFSSGQVYFHNTGEALALNGAGQKVSAWQPVRTAAEFGARDSSRLLSMGGSLLLSGGFFSSPNWGYQDLWKSEDSGSNWFLLNGSSIPSQLSGYGENRYDPYSPILPWGDGLVAVGSAVWTSVDGANWMLLTSAGPGVASEDTQLIYLGGKLLYVDAYRSKVSSSSDGIIWNSVPINPEVGSRCGAIVQKIGVRIYLISGGACDYTKFYDDVWFSDDGEVWQQAKDTDGKNMSIPFKPRMWACSTTSRDGYIWVYGGYSIENSQGVNRSDVWFTKDGVVWDKLKDDFGLPFADSSFDPTHASACNFDDANRRLLVVAGKGHVSPLNRYSYVKADVYGLNIPKLK
ncbi:MAG: hypothetical protein IPJ08_21285 [Burkholderiales bacterium]|nr:hypothetical protein [Burkholderiales bacterium]